MSSERSSGSTLRSSCDRCRAQKLRCVPASKSGSRSPCQRCQRLKTATPCIFSCRRNSGRQNRAADEGGSQCADTDSCESPGLPGMFTFSLSRDPVPLSPVSEPRQSCNIIRPARSARSTRPVAVTATPDQDTSIASIDSSPQTFLTGFWDSNSALFSFEYPDQSIFRPDTSSPSFMQVQLPPEEGDRDFRCDGGDGDGGSGGRGSVGADCDAMTGLDFHNAPISVAQLPSCLPTSLSLEENENENENDNENEHEHEHEHENENASDSKSPGTPVVDLTALLAKMSQYMSQIAMLPLQGDLDGYPIGDAIFLAQSFYIFLSSHSCSYQPQQPRQSLLQDSQDMSSTLLALSCYFSLIRIYMSVFTSLCGRLNSFIHDVQAHTGTSSQEARSPRPSLASTRAYQGLLLGQLTPGCLCEGKETARRTQQALSMLLDSLAGVEAALGLPPDLRVVVVPSVEPPSQDSEAKHGNDGQAVGKQWPLAADIANGPLYRDLRKQTSRVLASVERIQGLLQGFFI